MVAKQWKFINGFEWAVMDPVVEKPGELWMCLTLAYGTLDVKPEEMGALHVLMESIRTELQRPVEYAPGKFDVAQVECLTYFSEIDIRVHGPREIVRQAWLRLPACFEHPELLLPVSGRCGLLTWQTERGSMKPCSPFSAVIPPLSRPIATLRQHVILRGNSLPSKDVIPVFL